MPDAILEPHDGIQSRQWILEICISAWRAEYWPGTGVCAIQIRCLLGASKKYGDYDHYTRFAG